MAGSPVALALRSNSGSLSSSPGPHSRSTNGNFRIRSRPSRSAMHPSTPSSRSGWRLLRAFIIPRRDHTFCSACSRTEHVLYRITPAASASAVNRYPSARNCDTTSSESSSFIWHPNVSRYTSWAASNDMSGMVGTAKAARRQPAETHDVLAPPALPWNHRVVKMRGASLSVHASRLPLLATR